MIPTKNIYLDHAGTTPLSASMKTYLTSLLDLYGNPSSIYSIGEESKQIISKARQSVAQFIHVDPSDIYFTGGGSAGNTLAIKGLVSEHPQLNRYEVFYSPTAHKSMLKACESCICHTPLKVNSVGELDLSYLDQLLAQHHGLRPLVCMEAANSETGAINNVPETGAVVRRHQGILAVDATGYIPSYQIDMRLWMDYVDLLTFSGHKLHALKGIGALWKRHDLELKPLIYGSQEQGLVGGTENILGIASLGKAVEDYDYSSITSHNRDYVYDYIMKNIPDSYLAGPCIESGNRLPHNLYMCFKDVEGESLLLLLDINGIQVSTGSACNSKSLSASPALSAMGISEDDIHSFIRFTFSGQETKEELNYICEKLNECVNHLRNLNIETKTG